MPEFFRILETGIEPTVAKLRASGDRALGFETIFERIAFDMMRIEDEIFKSQGRRSGGSWARLKQSTILKKGMSSIYYTSGANPGYSKFGDNTLVRSLTELNAPYQILAFTNSTLEFGTSRPYAGVLASGSSKRNIPARPFLNFITEDKIRWDQWLMDHLMEPFFVSDSKAPE